MPAPAAAGDANWPTCTPMTLDLPAYGSDPSGLVCGYRFGPDGAGQAISSAQMLEWLRRDRADKGAGFVWLHFALTNTASEKWLPALWLVLRRRPR